jgi:adenylate cyclase class 2
MIVLCGGAAMLEAELKLKIENDRKEGVSHALEVLNPNRIEHVEYEDVYFDTATEDLLKSDKELRVRKISDGDARVLLTYKDPPFHAETKSKPEFEVEVNCYDSICEIVKKLGYIEDIRFKKICTNYYLHYNSYQVVATLVALPGIDGYFLELETQVASEDMVDSALTSLYELVDNLSVPRSNLTTEYYTEMVRTMKSKSSDAEPAL